MAENDVEVGFAANLSGLEKGFAEAASSAKNGAEGLKDALDPAKIAVVGLGVAMASFAENILGKVKDSVNEAIHAYSNLGDELEHMQHRLGGTAEELSALKVGLDSVGLSTGQFESVALRLSMVIEQNEDKFKKANVAIRDSNGNMLASQDIIQNLVTHMEKFSAGASRNAEGSALMGRAWRMMADFVEMTSERMKEAKKVAEDFGLTLTDKDLQATNEFLRQTKLLNIALQGFYVTVGQALTPILTQLAIDMRDALLPVFQAFRDIITNFGAEAFTVAMSTIKEILSSIWEVARAVGDVFSALVGIIGAAFDDPISAMDLFKITLQTIEVLVIGFRVSFVLAFSVISASIEVTAAGLRMFGGVASAALHMDWVGIAGAWKKGMADIDAVITKTTSKIVSETQKANIEMAALLQGGAKPGATPSSSAGGGAAPKTTKTGADTRLTDWKLELQIMKEAEGDFFKDSLDMEERFWIAKLATVSTKGKENIKLRQQISSELYNVHKQQAMQGRQLDEEAIAIEQKNALQGVEIERGAITSMRSMQQISAKEETSDLVELANVEYSIKMLALAKKLDLYKSEKIKKQQMLDEMKELDAKHAADVNKIYADAAKQRYDEQRAIDLESINHKVEMAKMDVEAEKYRNGLKSELGIISRDEQIAAEAELSNKLYGINLAHLDAQIEFYRQDAVKFKELTDEKERIAREHAHELERINGQILQEQRSQMERMLSPIVSAVDQSIKGMIAGTTTWRKALQNIFQSILGEFISMITKMVAHWLVGEIMKTSATQTGTATRATMETAAAGKSILASAGAAIKNIMNYAAETFAAIYKAIAGIPFIGPFLAPAMAVAGMASVAGVAGSVMSAEHGFDIPKGLNPLVQTHEREMVLPAEQADVIRGLKGGGGGDVHFYVTAMDAAGVKKFFMDNGHHLAKALRQQARNFTPIKAPTV